MYRTTTIFNDMYRTTTKNMASFPTLSLGWARHTTTFCDSPADQIKDANGGPPEEGRQKDTDERLLACVGRVSGVDFSNGWKNHIDTLPGPEHQGWAASLVEHLMEAGFYVIRHGEPMPMQDEPVHRLLQLKVS